MAFDRTLTPAACGILVTYLQRKGRPAEAKRYETQEFEHAESLQRAAVERRHVDHTAPLVPHGLSASTIQNLRNRLSTFPDIRAADLARLAVAHFPERPHFIFAVTLDLPWYKHRAITVDPEVVKAVSNLLGAGAGLYAFVVRTDWRVLARRVAAEPESRIYQKR